MDAVGPAEKVGGGGQTWRRPSGPLPSGDTTSGRMIGVTLHGVVSPDLLPSIDAPSFPRDAQPTSVIGSVAGGSRVLQGHLAPKKPSPYRTLQYLCRWSCGGP